MSDKEISALSGKKGGLARTMNKLRGENKQIPTKMQMDWERTTLALEKLQNKTPKAPKAVSKKPKKAKGGRTNMLTTTDLSESEADDEDEDLDDDDPNPKGLVKDDGGLEGLVEDDGGLEGLYTDTAGYADWAKDPLGTGVKKERVSPEKRPASPSPLEVASSKRTKTDTQGGYTSTTSHQPKVDRAQGKTVTQDKAAAKPGKVLDFQASELPGSEVPSTLAVPDKPISTMIHLPVVVRAADGSTFEITTVKGDLKDDDSFWIVLGEKMKKWQGALTEGNFGAISKDELDLLKTGSQVLPGLVGWDGRLLYEQDKVQKINKSEYKGYLSMIAGNVLTLQEKMKEDSKKADLKNPLKRSKVAQALGTGLRGKLTVTSEELTEVTKGQTSFYMSTVELVRRELVSYGIGVSNLAAATQVKRLELGLVAGYVRDMVKRTSKGLTATTSGSSKGPTVATSGSSKGPTAAASDSSKDLTAATSDSTKGPTATPSDPSVEQIRPPMKGPLPAVFIKAIDMHKCHCIDCDPAYLEALKDNARQVASREYQATVEAEQVTKMRKDMYDRAYSKMSSETWASAREDMKKEILDKELKALKTKLEKQLEEDWKAGERVRIKAEIKAELVEKEKEARRKYMDSFSF